MPAGAQVAMPRWVATGIYMQHDIIKQKIDTTIYWTFHRSEHQGMAKKTFKFAPATLWNSLPDHFRTENSFSQFKSLMQSWNGTKCCCSACMT
jgi:hypothetical protein